MPHPARHFGVPQQVLGMQAYPGGQSAFDVQSVTESQKLSSQQKQLPSVSALQYAAPNGPQPDPHW
jgi:hypothetical protein